jgi:hypothetical protein
MGFPVKTFLGRGKHFIGRSIGQCKAAAPVDGDNCGGLSQLTHGTWFL